MAAVFALVFLFAFASVMLVIKVIASGATFGTVLAGVCFSALAIGVVYALFKMARGWEGEHTHTT